MPRHDLPETQAETNARVEQQLRELMTLHGVRELVDLPRDALRRAIVEIGEAGGAEFHRLLIERKPR